jgi:UDP-N-acetylglucosamine 4-epimerase
MTDSDEPCAVFNVAVGERATLMELFEAMRSEVARFRPDTALARLTHSPPRIGDVRHSLADINTIQAHLGYRPVVRLREGLRLTVDWFASHHESSAHAPVSLRSRERR